MDFSIFRNVLLDLRESVLSGLDEFGNVVVQSERVADELDQAQLDLETALSTKFISRKSSYLRKIKKALAKIEDGSYGVCEDCGDGINEKRLLARPTATLCLSCKTDQEIAEKREKERLHRTGILDFDN